LRQRRVGGYPIGILLQRFRASS